MRIVPSPALDHPVVRPSARIATVAKLLGLSMPGVDGKVLSQALR